MGYLFRGFLTKSAPAAEAAARRWPFCEAKRVENQMEGFIVRSPSEDDLHPTDGDDAYERVIEQFTEVSDGLESLSAEFPGEVFVYIEVRCFGGTCINTGLHMLDGRTVASFEDGPDEADLTEILRPMGVSFGEDQYFEPFTRGYFERDRLQAWGRSGDATEASAP